MADDEFRNRVIASLAGVWLDVEVEEQLACDQAHSAAVYHPGGHTILRRTKIRIVGAAGDESKEGQHV